MNPIFLPELIQYAWQNRHSDFYRKFWARHGFNPGRDFWGQEDLERVPILTKRDLLRSTTRERSILESKEYYYFTAPSSGTTAEPLISLHQYYAVPRFYRFIEDLPQYGYSAVLVLRPGINVNAFLGSALPQKFYRPGSIIAVGDTQNLELSAHIAKQIEMDRLAASSSLAIRFATTLADVGYPLDRVKLIHLVGEPVTSAATALLRQLYPYALLLYTYGMTEGPCFIGMRSSLCTQLGALSPGAYHLDTENLLLEAVRGSLAVTALHKIPTPLIRYDTGDLIVVKENFRCDCGFPTGPVGIIGPRLTGKSYKIGSMIFHREDISRLLLRYSYFYTPDFVLRLEQRVKQRRLITIPTLILRPKQKRFVSLLVNPKLSPFVISRFKTKFEQELPVWTRDNLASAIQRGIAEPIHIRYDDLIRGQWILPPEELAKPFRDHLDATLFQCVYGRLEDVQR